MPRTLQDATLYACLSLNWLMLALGLLMEVSPRSVPGYLGLSLGGVAFVGSFTFLSMFVDRDDGLSVALFVTMYVVWALYGVAAALPEVPEMSCTMASTWSPRTFMASFSLPTRLSSCPEPLAADG